MIDESSKGRDSPKSKQEGNDNKGCRLKDPRIVRVSRAFGGKDRHSKVCTIRGLRDRRVRLSVPTAIQLYDLQDRLGLNQPSKVVDWLLNAAKNEIDDLPPLPLPLPFPLPHQGNNFSSLINPQMLQESSSAAASGANSQANKLEDDPGVVGLSRSSFRSSNAFWRAKSKQVLATETPDEKDEKQQEGGHDHHHHHVAQVNHSFNAVPNNNYGSYYQYLEPCSNNFPFSHLGISGHGFGASSHDHSTEDQVVHGFNVVPLPSGNSPILVCQPPAASGPTIQPLFPPHASSLEIDPRQHFQMLSSSSGGAPQNLLLNSLNAPVPYSISTQSIRPFHLSMMTSRLHHSHNNSGSQPDNKEHHE